jgi:GDPmannose 4,6-dehydratase
MPNVKCALITGAGGQDGRYLAALLLKSGYEVHALDRVPAPGGEGPLDLPGVSWHTADLLDAGAIRAILESARPQECYHLAARTFVEEYRADGIETLAENVAATHNLLAAIRRSRPDCRMFFAASSEVFGAASESPQCESTPMAPRNPYGISKATGVQLVDYYRERFGLYAVAGILYNHESPLRPPRFVTGKIVRGAVEVKLGVRPTLQLGDLDARRDWGHAADTVRAMHLALQQPAPDDYIVATGETHSVWEFCDVAFRGVGLDYRDYVQVDPALSRPADAVILTSKAEKARNRLGWRPEYTFERLVEEMVAAEMQARL